MKRAALFVAVGACLSVPSAALGARRKPSALSVPDLAQLDLEAREELTNALVDARHYFIGKLIDQLRKGPEQGREHVIYLLGRFRARRAVNPLMDIIDWEAKVMDDHTRIPRWWNHPAQGALVQIGKRASREALRRLPKEENEFRRQLMALLMCDVEGEDLAIRILRDELDRTEEGEARTRLKAAVERLQLARKLRLEADERARRKAEEEEPEDPVLPVEPSLPDSGDDAKGL